MTSRRVTAATEADAVVAAVEGDLAAAVEQAEAWGLPAATVAVLRDRRDHADPFGSFPR